MREQRKRHVAGLTPVAPAFPHRDGEKESVRHMKQKNQFII